MQICLASMSLQIKQGDLQTATLHLLQSSCNRGMQIIPETPREEGRRKLHRRKAGAGDSGISPGAGLIGRKHLEKGLFVATINQKKKKYTHLCSVLSES